MAVADPPASRHHFRLLLLSATIVVLSAALDLDGNGTALPGLDGRPLPGICLTRILWHIDCPGCGITRSFVAMAHGELRRAFRLHRVGPLAFLFILLQVPLRACAVLSGALPEWARRPRTTTLLLWTLVIALWLNWVYNLATGAVFR